MKVYIGQLKCPSNHCVVALAGEYETIADAVAGLQPKVMNGFKTAVAKGLLNYECGLCHSTSLAVEVKPTIFATMEEAEPFLAEEQLRQLAVQERLRSSRN